MLKNFKGNLARKFTIYVVIASTAVTILTSAYQLYDDYLRDISEIESKLEELERTQLSGLSFQLWRYDEEGVQVASQSILDLNLIEYVEVRDNNDLFIAIGEKPLKSFREEEYPLYHKVRGENLQVGSITVLVTLEGVYQHIYDQLLVIIVGNTLKTFIVSGIILFVFFQLIGKHLTAIGTFANEYRVGLTEDKLELKRKVSKSQKGDELSFLVTALGDMQDRINSAVRDVIAREEAEKALRASDERFRDYAESSSDWFWEMDENLNITYGSNFFFELTGIRPEDLYYKGRRALVNKELEDVKSEKWQKHFSQLKNREPFRNFESRLMGRDNEIITISLNGNPIYTTEGAFLGYRGTGTDVSKQKKVEKQLEYQASHDALTGLISRYEFEQRVTRLLFSTSKEKNTHAMCFLDLDQFKVINDTCGHSAGDELLRQIGRILTNTIRKRDTLARLGGDEFGVLMEHCTLEQAQRVTNDILNVVMGYQFFWSDNVFRIGVSIGLVAITEASGNFTELLKQADAACYMAKDLGRNRIHVYHPDDTELAFRHGEMQWVARINQALDKDRLCLYAQPIISLDSGDNRHYELLVRMLDDNGDIIPPGSFLPAAERYNLIEKVDAWVVSHACTFLSQQRKFLDHINFVTINLSGPSLTNSSFLGSILSILNETGVPPGKICFEVTETVAVSNMNLAIGFIKDLKEIGCHFALDDFGSGISSFGYLKNLPVDYLKIDGMFVKDILENPIDYAMVKSINEIGQVMGMKTIAEFVENDETKATLKTIGVNYAQGYGIGKPEPLIDLVSTTDKDQQSE